MLSDCPLTVKSISLSHARALQLLEIAALQTTLENIHKEVEAAVYARRKRVIEAHNKATNIVTPSFSVGDFVLVRRAVDRGHKLKFRWFGPCRIYNVHGHLVYGATPLRDGKVEIVHSARLLKYRDSFLGKPVPEDMLDLAERTESRYDIIEKIVEVAEADDGIFFQVQWKGLPDKRDLNWQPIHELYTDVPDMVTNFIYTYKNKKLVETVRRHLGISSDHN